MYLGVSSDLRTIVTAGLGNDGLIWDPRVPQFSFQSIDLFSRNIDMERRYAHDSDFYRQYASRNRQKLDGWVCDSDSNLHHQNSERVMKLQDAEQCAGIVSLPVWVSSRLFARLKPFAGICSKSPFNVVST